MKRRITVIGSVAVATAVAILFVWRSGTQKFQRSERTIDAAHTSNSPGATARFSAPPAPTVPELKEREQKRVQTVVQAIEMTNVPISFWGKVIDQDQQPIGDVDVRYNYSTEHGSISGQRWSEQKIHNDQAKTDISGIFVISGIKGHALVIESLEKKGYKYKPKGAATYNYYGDTASGKFVPQPAEPVVFVMIKGGAAESLVMHGGTFGTLIRLPGEGTPFRWDIWKGRSDPSGELQITFKREPVVLTRVGQPITWLAKVATVRGGIAEVSANERFYQAPEDGYVPELDYPKSEQRRGVSARSFYIKTADGKYGLVELEIYPDDEGSTARCLIKTVINPSGSRNLEF